MIQLSPSLNTENWLSKIRESSVTKHVVVRNNAVTKVTKHVLCEGLYKQVSDIFPQIITIANHPYTTAVNDNDSI